MDWTLSFKEAFRNSKELYTFLGWEIPSATIEVEKSYPVFVPKSLALKIRSQGPSGVLARQFLPRDSELDQALNTQGLIDPIGDKIYQKAPQLIHRYSSRALFTATSVCPVHCRYCFRKNELNQPDELFTREFSKTIAYLQAHPEISEIIFTGGDPFTLSNARLEKYIFAFAKIPSLKDLRFHTRYPVIIPERFDPELLEVLKKAAAHFRTVSIAIHANHGSEFDQASRDCIRSLGALPIQLLSQSVLLKDVNDHPATLVELFNEFIELKVRPYYLHHPDRVKGAMHFYLPLEQGRRVYQELRSDLPGWALPHYVIDIPGGHGKVSAFNPESIAFSGSLLSRKGSPILVPEITI